MADISFYKYLEAAFRHKLYKDTTAASFKYLDYSLPYESIGGKKGIFEYARKILPKFYTDQFDDTEEGHLQMAKAVLEKLERKQDRELVKQFEGYNVAEDQQVIQEAKEQSGEVSQQAAVGEPARTMAGGGYAPSLPQTPLMRTAPRIYKLPGQLAGKEGGTGEGTAATNKAARLDAEKTVPEELGTTQKTSESDNLKSRNSGKPSLSESFRTPRIPGSFVNAFKNFGSKLGVFFKRNFGKFLTMGRIATGAGAVIGGFAGAGLTGGASMGVLGGSIGGAILPSWVRSGGAGRFFGRAGNGVINFGARLSNQVGKGGLKLAGPKKKVALLFLGSFLLFGLAAGLLGALNPGGTPTGTGLPPGTIVGAGCPDTSTNTNGFSCRYLNPSIGIFDTTISQSATDSYITKYSTVFINAGKGDLAEFTKRTNYIVTNSQQAGLNPAIFLGYWKTESLFSTIGSRDLGCAGNGFYEEVDCALGINKFSDPVKNPIANCTRSKDADSTACKALKSLRQTYDKTHPVKYPIATFDDFAESYGPYDHLTNGLPTNCISTYNKLIEVSKELNACKTTTATASTKVEVTKDGPKVARSETELTYQISVSNNETGKVNVRLSDRLPSELEFKSASDEGVFEQGVVKWDLKDIAPGSTKTLTLVTFVKPLPSGVSEINITNPKVDFDKY